MAATLRAVAQMGLGRRAVARSEGQERGSLSAGATETEGGSGGVGGQAGAGGAGGGGESSSSGGDESSGAEGGFNFLHLPMENGWLELCA